MIVSQPLWCLTRCGESNVFFSGVCFQTWSLHPFLINGLCQHITAICVCLLGQKKKHFSITTCMLLFTTAKIIHFRKDCFQNADFTAVQKLSHINKTLLPFSKSNTVFYLTQRSMEQEVIDISTFYMLFCYWFEADNTHSHGSMLVTYIYNQWSAKGRKFL